MESDGKHRLKAVLNALREKRPWESILEGFQHVEEVPNGRDLRGARLSGENLCQVDLRETDLAYAVLGGANLSRADVRGAIFQGADLSTVLMPDATAQKAKFPGARMDLSVFRHTDFTEAYMNGADLRGADMNSAILRRAHLRGTDLSRASLNDAYLDGAVLTGATMLDAWLVAASLQETDLSVTQLFKTNLSHADLAHANLTEADLRGARLVAAKLNKANLTGAKLYGTIRDEWTITAISCRYVYWDFWYKERFPKDRDFEVGEFQDQYRSLPTIECGFESGMTPLDYLIMEQVVRDIRQKAPEFDMRIASLVSGVHSPSMKFTIRHEAQKEAALTELQAGLQKKRRQLEGRYETILQAITEAIDRAGEVELSVVPAPPKS